MVKNYTISELRLRLMAAKERLALERLNIFRLYPSKKNINRATYGFIYLQSERACLAAITNRMDEMEWLPVRLDSSAEINADNRDRMTRWIRQGENIIPGEEVFGNAFVHAITRCALLNEVDGEATQRLADRVALLFRDLTCLMAAIHCCNLCVELQIERVELSAPHDLGRLAFDLTLMTEAMLALAADEMDEDEDGDPAILADNENRQPLPHYLKLVPDIPPNTPLPEH